MAVTVTIIRQGTYSAEFDVTFSADGDTAAVVPHGLGAIPDNVSLRPVTPATMYVGTVTVGVVDATNVNLVKANAVGSGAGTVACRVQVQRYHSIER